jgi:hypothetical protein
MRGQIWQGSGAPVPVLVHGLMGELQRRTFHSAAIVDATAPMLRPQTQKFSPFSKFPF